MVGGEGWKMDEVNCERNSTINGGGGDGRSSARCVYKIYKNL